MKYEGISLLQKKINGENKTVKSIVCKIHAMLLEAEDQEELLKSLLEFDMGKEISTSEQKNVLNIKI